MDHLINILIVIKWPLALLIALFVGLIIVLVKEHKEKDEVNKAFLRRVNSAICAAMIGCSLGAALILSTSPITKPMTHNERFAPEPVVEQVQEKAGDPLPSRLKEPKKSNIDEKIDIKDEVKEILKK